MSGKCIRGLDALDAAVRGCALSIGNFDGVHLGHQRLVEIGRRHALACGAAMVAMTFEPPPDQVLRPDDVIKRIVPVELKARLLLDAGCDLVVLVTADRELLSMTPQQFIDEIVVARFAPSHVVEGPDFSYGRKRSGTIDTLREAAAAGGFEVHVVEPLQLELDGQEHRISSSLIRLLVERGRVGEARRCLGKDFALCGEVVRGAGRGGQLLGFPTVNLHSPQQVCPADGVYAGWAELDGTRSVAAISIGSNPTLHPASGRSVEAHLLDARGDFYGRRMKLEFVERLRDQRKFESIDALQEQIAKDIEHVRRIVE